jgi:hypothetical protein
MQGYIRPRQASVIGGIVLKGLLEIGLAACARSRRVDPVEWSSWNTYFLRNLDAPPLDPGCP